jgi:hypothetical protein
MNMYIEAEDVVKSRNTSWRLQELMIEDFGFIGSGRSRDMERSWLPNVQRSTLKLCKFQSPELLNH